MDVAVGGTGVEVGGSVGTTVGVGCDVDVPHPANNVIETTSISKRRDTANIFLLVRLVSPLSPRMPLCLRFRILPWAMPPLA